MHTLYLCILVQTNRPVCIVLVDKISPVPSPCMSGKKKRARYHDATLGSSGPEDQKPSKSQSHSGAVPKNFQVGAGRSPQYQVQQTKTTQTKFPERRTPKGNKFRISKDEDISFENSSVIRPEMFAMARSREITVLASTIPPPVQVRRQPRVRRCGHEGLATERMPLRRRAASYRSYKMPLFVRLHPRKKARLDPSVLFKTPCRAKRRSRKALILRQLAGLRHTRDGPAWLETHLWHSKRMHMQNLWGFRLAMRRADAGPRAALRWIENHCTVYDASYTSCFELKGSENELLALLNDLAPTTAAAARRSAVGGRELECVLYAFGQHPHGVIAPGRVLWRPTGGMDARQLWIWVHPVAGGQLSAELEQACSFSHPHSRTVALSKSPTPGSDAPSDGPSPCRGYPCSACPSLDVLTCPPVLLASSAVSGVIVEEP